MTSLSESVKILHLRFTDVDLFLLFYRMSGGPCRPAEEPIEVMSRWSLMELVDGKKADEVVARVTKTIEQ